LSQPIDISLLADKVIDGARISLEEAESLLSSSDLVTLAASANRITRHFMGDSVDVEALLNAKSGRCPEDCSFCAQSSFYDTDISKYPLLPASAIVEQAKRAQLDGASSFCIVCAYREPPERDFEQICNTICQLKDHLDLDVNVSLGFMTKERALRLKKIGVKRYNHNLETAASNFAKICRTHEFQDRVSTAKIVKEAGLELCCGGIIGMGETQRQRLELAFSIAELDPDEVPINILMAREGTPFQGMGSVTPEEAIKTIAVWRFILPRTILKIAGGREIHLGEKDSFALKAGANGIITGGYLTTGGNAAERDLAMIQNIGLHPS
jgi:biotin synthase